MSQFLLHILSVPALVRHLGDVCPREALDGLLFHPEHSLVWRSVGLLAKDEQQLRIHFNALEGSYALCLTANLVHAVAIHAARGESSQQPGVNILP